MATKKTTEKTPAKKVGKISRNTQEECFAFELHAFTGMRLDIVDEVIEKASSRLNQEAVALARDQRERAIDFYVKNNHSAAIESGRALWWMTNVLNYHLDVRDRVRMATAVLTQRQRAGFSSGNERRAERQAEWNSWQAEVDKVRQELPGLAKSRVFEIVATHFGRTRPAIAKRVLWR